MAELSLTNERGMIYNNYVSANIYCVLYLIISTIVLKSGLCSSAKIYFQREKEIGRYFQA